MKRLNQQLGFNMLELLVAMMLGVFVIGGLGVYYLSTTEAASRQLAMAEMDENARHAMRTLVSSIEHAGYSGLAGRFPYEPIIFSDNEFSPASCNDGTANAKNTDSGITSDGSSVEESKIAVSFLADDELYRGCTGTEVRTDCRVGQAPAQEAARVFNVFYLSHPAGDKNVVGETIPALFCSDSLRAASAQIAQGVAGLAFRFGVDTDRDGAVDNYLRSDAITKIPELIKMVVAVELAVLIRSIDPFYDTETSQQVDLLDREVTKTDRYRYRAYNTTVKLRNPAMRQL